MGLGPDFGTNEYKRQVETIRTVIGEGARNIKEANQMAMAYILDSSYSRAAISQALKHIKHQLKSTSHTPNPLTIPHIVCQSALIRVNVGLSVMIVLCFGVSLCDYDPSTSPHLKLACATPMTSKTIAPRHCVDYCIPSMPHSPAN